MEIEFDWIDEVVDGEHNGAGSVEIATTLSTQDGFLLETGQFDYVYHCYRLFTVIEVAKQVRHFIRFSDIATEIIVLYSVLKIPLYDHNFTCPYLS